jgi:hypothetical protein
MLSMCSLRRAAWLGLIVMLAAAGCNSRSTSKYVPPQESARKALEQSLDAWQNGQAPGLISDAPQVQAVDSYWRAGQKLVSYEILEEEANEGPRVFSVRLNVVRARQPMVVRYYVVGRDPMLVYREDDYKAPAGM